MTEPSTTPETIGPYRVVRPVARGGMAAVYEVVEPETGRRIALKLLERGVRGPHRFGREFRALTRLDHPNIVRVYRFGVSDDDTPFLTMELLDGVPAQVYAKQCGRPGTPERIREAVRIIGEVARALVYLHRRGIVHRDLKSSNVLVLRDGRVKVLDFGTVRLADAEERITRKGEFVGTYAYAAPEQFTGGEVDARTDLYSLGVLFYRLLTGHRPFDSDDPHELRKMHTLERPVDPCTRVPGIPEPVGAIVMHLLRKEPDERPRSADRVMQALVRHAGERPRQVGLQEPALDGRAAVLEHARQWLSKPRKVLGGSLFLMGPMGVGAAGAQKQLAGEAEQMGWAVLSASLSPQPGIWAFSGLIRAIARWGGVRSDPELGRLLAAVSRTPSVSASQGVSDEMLLGVFRRAVERNGRPALLVVRDVDAAPIDALMMLGNLCQKDSELSVLGCSTADSDALRTRLSESFSEARFLRLEPMDYADCYRLVGSLLGLRSPPPRLVGRLFEATGGRSDFVLEVARGMLAEGLAKTDESTGTVDVSGGRVPLPVAVAEPVSRRIGVLSPLEREVLEVLSLAGGPLGARVMTDVMRQDDAEVLSALERLTRTGLLVEVAEGAARALSFELLGDVVRNEMAPESRERMVQRLANSVRGGAPNPGSVRLFLQAGRLADASRTAVVWGQSELERGHPDVVAPMVGRVVHAWSRMEGRPGCPGPLLMLQAAAWVELEPGSQRAAAVLDAIHDRPDVPQAASALLLAQHLRWRPAPMRAEQQLEEAAELARALDDTRTIVAVAYERAERLVTAGRFEGARQVLDAVDTGVRRMQESSLGLRVLLLRAHAFLAEGRGEQAQAVLDGLPADARWLGPRERGLLAVARAAVAGFHGQWTEVLTDILAPALARARRLGDPICHALLLAKATEARMALYQLGEARELLEESRAAGLRGLPWFQVTRAMYDGVLLEQSGSSKGAVTTLRDAAELAGRYALRVDEARSRAKLGRALLRTGRLDEGLRALDAAAAIASDLEAGPHHEDIETCRVESLLMARAPITNLRKAAVLEARRLCGAGRARIRVRACVALLESGALRPEERSGVITTSLEALDLLESSLDGEARAAFRVHPWRVASERAAQGLHTVSQHS